MTLSRILKIKSRPQHQEYIKYCSLCTPTCTYRICGNVEDRNEVRNALANGPYTVNDVQ